MCRFLSLSEPLNFVHHILVIISALSYLLPFYLTAQIQAINEPWRWVQFTTQSGLPSNRVFQIYESRSGKIWAETQNGIAWYNGYYWQGINQSHGLPGHQIMSIVDAPGDSVYTITGGHLYIGSVSGFRKIPLMYKSQPYSVISMASISGDSLLIMSDSSLFIFHNGSFTPYRRPRELDSSKVLNMWNQRSGNIWLNTMNGVYRYDHNTWKLKLKLKAGSLPIYISTMAENNSGCGIAMLSSPKKYFGVWEWDESGTMRYLASEVSTTAIALGIAANNDAILVKESGDVRIRENGIWRTVSSVPDQFQMVISIQYCSDGNLWLSTEKGLFLNKRNSKRWTDLRFPPPDARNSINAILPRKDGTVWLATGGGLVVRYPDGRIGTTTHIMSKPVGHITGLQEDLDENVWISSGASFDGAYRWNGTSWKHFGYQEGLDAGTIHRIKKDRQGRLWFLGLLRTDFETRNIEQEPGAHLLDNGKFIELGPNDGLLGGRVLTFADESDGTLWFGTSTGLSRRKPDGKWNYWTMTSGLLTNRIFTLAVDSSGTVWFGDQASGLGYIQNDSVRYLTTEDGLISNSVWNIQVDPDGKLWIGTHSGVSVYNNGTWSKFDGKDGLENVRIWPIVVRPNIIYFGTNGGGVEILHLNEMRKEQPIVLISQPVVKENSVVVQCRPYAYWNEQESEDILIRYRFDHTPWSAWTTKRIITQDNLSSGDHTIEFQSLGVLGTRNAMVWSNTFSVELPLYLQPRFFLPVGFLLVTIFTIGVIFINRKRTQDQVLRLSELRYRSLFENTTDPIVVFDPTNNSILELNKKASEIYGYKKPDLVHKPVSVLSKDFEIERQYIQHAIEDHTVQTYESFHLKKDRNEFPVLVNMSVVEYGGSSVILSINRDISEQLQAETKIRLLAQTIASAQDYVTITDLDNNILFVNESFTKAYGYSIEELYGKHISILHSVLTPLDVFENVYSTTRGGGWNGELFNRKKDGSEFLVELWTSPVSNEEGTPVAFVGIARDITERKRVEKERDTLIQNLTEAIAEVKTLSGLLPICSSCKKIRDDKGYWTQVETYIAKYSAATFTHGLCPDCLKEYFPEVYNRMKDKGPAG